MLNGCSIASRNVLTLLMVHSGFMFTLNFFEDWLISKKGKTIPVQAVEAHRIVRGWGSHISDIQLIEGGTVVSPMRQPLFTPRKISGTHFC
jgi:hypothetical protein